MTVYEKMNFELFSTVCDADGYCVVDALFISSVAVHRSHLDWDKILAKIARCLRLANTSKELSLSIIEFSEHAINAKQIDDLHLTYDHRHSQLAPKTENWMNLRWIIKSCMTATEMRFMKMRGFFFCVYEMHTAKSMYSGKLGYMRLNWDVYELKVAEEKAHTPEFGFNYSASDIPHLTHDSDQKRTFNQIPSQLPTENVDKPNEFHHSQRIQQTFQCTSSKDVMRFNIQREF